MASDRVTYSMENGSVSVELDPWVPKKYLKAAGMTGSGIAPTKVNMLTSVRGGGRFQSSVRLARSMDLPITIFGDNRAVIEDNLRQLVAVFQDRFSTPYLVATYPDGTQYETEFHYQSGADHQWGSGDTDGKNFVKWPISIVCPSPYWTSRNPVSFEVKAPTGRGLLRGPLSDLRLSSSQALGTVSLFNDGDVEAYPIAVIRGPGTGFTASRLIDGASLVYVGTIASTDVITIDTKAATITDQNGTNLFGGLVGAPKFFTIPPGNSSISAQLTGATANSSIFLSFKPRRELIF